ncbi:unnamed protein product [Zymoseptoria tritici ST99CH_1E4]|uniref:Uncharacterized protein n=1 Tax=Zymoseptoria tritici ST99CH_1E4 TaxID=1276532 RepID=A0A2H1GZ91_ZYMTR|nr:unnamed protein product [Zymoseptoria tritici ST99CH_1E4]
MQLYKLFAILSLASATFGYDCRPQLGGNGKCILGIGANSKQEIYLECASDSACFIPGAPCDWSKKHPGYADCCHQGCT